jgi:hypothetical protein
MDSFIRTLRLSGLISEEKLAARITEFWEAIGDTTSDPAVFLAALLVEKGDLTCWQCEKLSAGRFKGFFVDNYVLVDHLATGHERSYYLAKDIARGTRAVLGFLPDKTGTSYIVLKQFPPENR